MTTPTPRWTAETEELVRQELVDFDYTDPEFNATHAVLTALADAGVLTAVGGETILVRDCPGADCRRHPFGEHTHSRTVTSYPDGSQHFGPWREVTDDPA